MWEPFLKLKYLFSKLNETYMLSINVLKINNITDIYVIVQNALEYLCLPHLYFFSLPSLIKVYNTKHILQDQHLHVFGVATWYI